jgi:RING finger protein 170
LCGGDDGNVNAAIATKNGGVELVCDVCSKISISNGSQLALISALNAMASLLRG